MSNPKPPPIGKLLRLLQAANWSEPYYTREQAYVCAVFSEAAYWQLQEFEFGRRGQIKVVPSDAIQLLAANRTDGSAIIAAAAREGELEPPSVIVTRGAIVTVWKTSQVVIVAIRGTKYLYDWWTNLRFARRRVADGLRVHRGFLSAISAALPELAAVLAPSVAAGTPICVTGHSLGGAMAAILHAMWPSWDYRRSPLNWIMTSRHQRPLTVSCYTFGMPRFGNDNVVFELPSPHALVDPSDLVPRVPPTLFGYADTLHRFSADGGPFLAPSRGRVFAFFLWIWHLLTLTGLKAHKVERYRVAVEAKISTVGP